MACGGLKLCERDIDTRLLSSHHSVRVTDFALNALNVANSQHLRFGRKLGIKVGIHTGNVIAGVVGETKPQFSLIGPTVNKTSRVCSKCPKHKILVSKETKQALEDGSNNFVFNTVFIEMKGIGEEPAYTVHKRIKQNRNPFKSSKNSNWNGSKSPKRLSSFGGARNTSSYD